jgi:hypothetical protein
MAYRHVQRGTAIQWAVVVGAFVACAVFTLAMARGDANVGWGILFALLPVLAVFASVAWYFSSMTVEVTDNHLQWRLGRGGLYRIALAEIESAGLERHPWWQGYGIRWIGPNRWTYIVAGCDTVEVRLRSGGWRRLGTNDPRGLLAALGQSTS